ncbi:uncharacterized protein LOC119370310 [Jatropha curcas]|uniref:uncharacterized protein LOC119370310 n=1 Tax=Jatropha curcas TaxID=180498 RepID=UPI0018950C3A|nr:uncharacterized protein LOC119370310 [Jatropha curcas]
MMEVQTSSKNRGIPDDCDFITTMFSWSLEDIYNDQLFKVAAIPDLFESVEHYFSSYVLPLLEETRARLHSSMEIISKAPTSEVISLSRSRRNQTLFYDIKIDYWRNGFSDRRKEFYKTLPGDVVLLADIKPETVSDLQRAGRTWTLALVTNIPEDEIEDASASSTRFKVRPSKDIGVIDEMQKSFVVIFLTNMTTNRRIWNRLHTFGNLDIIKEVLCHNSMVEENCSLCSMQNNGTWDENIVMNLSSTLNESQTEASLACLCRTQCNHRSAVELIWGPPGTGKTKTISMFPFTLLRVKCRVLICAPTNVAITELASRVQKLVTESSETDSATDALFCSLGNILLFGHKDRLKVNSDIEDIYLDYRVKRLTECFAPSTGGRYCFTATKIFFEDCVCQYYIFLENELIKEQDYDQENKKKDESCSNGADVCSGKHKSFLEFMRERFCSTVSQLKRCSQLKRMLSLTITHIPESYILKHNIQSCKNPCYFTVLF